MTSAETDVATGYATGGNNVTTAIVIVEMAAARVVKSSVGMFAQGLPACRAVAETENGLATRGAMTVTIFPGTGARTLAPLS